MIPWPSPEPAPPQLLRFSLNRGSDSAWALEGAAVGTLVRCFPDLSSALDCARRACDAAAATIEIKVDGFYICVHQPKGWPRRICMPARAA